MFVGGLIRHPACNRLFACMLNALVGRWDACSEGMAICMSSFLRFRVGCVGRGARVRGLFRERRRSCSRLEARGGQPLLRSDRHLRPLWDWWGFRHLLFAVCECRTLGRTGVAALNCGVDHDTTLGVFSPAEQLNPNMHAGPSAPVAANAKRPPGPLRFPLPCACTELLYLHRATASRKLYKFLTLSS